MRNIKEPLIWAELWIDEEDNAHFQTHTRSEDYDQVKKSLIKFVEIIQKQIDGGIRCPFNPDIKNNK